MKYVWRNEATNVWNKIMLGNIIIIIKDCSDLLNRNYNIIDLLIGFLIHFKKFIWGKFSALQGFKQK